MKKPKEKKIKEEVRFHLDNLVLEIGKQVTRDYQNKNGIWEGMSVSNTKTVSLYSDLLLEVVESAISQSKQEVTKDVVKAIKRIQNKSRYQDYGWYDLETDLKYILKSLKEKKK